MGIFRKIPLEIEAFIFGKEPLPDWFSMEICKNNVYIKNNLHKYEGETFPNVNLECEIRTKEGIMTAKFGDYIIKEISDSERGIYPCSSDVFVRTYEEVNIDEVKF